MEFKVLKQEITLNGKTIPVNITIEVDEDQHVEAEGDFDFGSKEENKTYLNRFKSGELFMALITVKAEALDEHGFDVLGACHVHSNSAFNSKPFEDDVNITVETYSMIQSALEDLKKNIETKIESLKPYFKSEEKK